MRTCPGHERNPIQDMQDMLMCGKYFKTEFQVPAL